MLRHIVLRNIHFFDDEVRNDLRKNQGSGTEKFGGSSWPKPWKKILERNPRIQKRIKKSSFVSVTLIFIFWRIPGEDFFLGFRVKILQRKIHRRKLSKKGKLAQYLLSDAWFIADMGLEILAASFLRNFCTCFSCLYRILHLKTHVRFYCRLAVS